LEVLEAAVAKVMMVSKVRATKIREKKRAIFSEIFGEILRILGGMKPAERVSAVSREEEKFPRSIDFCYEIRNRLGLHVEEGLLSVSSQALDIVERWRELCLWDIFHRVLALDLQGRDSRADQATVTGEEAEEEIDEANLRLTQGIDFVVKHRGAFTNTCPLYR
jgi:hypothetical protein